MYPTLASGHEFREIHVQTLNSGAQLSKSRYIASLNALKASGFLIN